MKTASDIGAFAAAFLAAGTCVAAERPPIHYVDMEPKEVIEAKTSPLPGKAASLLPADGRWNLVWHAAFWLQSPSIGASAALCGDVRAPSGSVSATFVFGAKNPPGGETVYSNVKFFRLEDGR